MELAKAKEIAWNLIMEHCPTWNFKFDYAKRRFGCCRYRTKTISLSKPLTLMNTEQKMTQTILHEIAHALTEGHNHDRVWKAKAIELGHTGDRCSPPSSIGIEGRFVYECPVCYKESVYHRRIKRERACGDCCKTHNYGNYSNKYELRFKGKRRNG